jgi:tetratricopeptide (TPR) repeat protein
VLKRASLIEAARRRDWSKLPEILAYITSKDRDAVFAVSLIRIIPPSRDENLRATLLSAGKDPSPLVRAAAMQALGLIPSPETLQTLVEATADDYRVVRVRAAAALSQFPQATVPRSHADQLNQASEEYLASIMARPDQWTSHYNMGNYHLGRNELEQAIDSYKAALEREPEAVMAMVNASIAYSRMGQNDKAEQILEKALKTAPDNAEALFNLGLLKAEKADLRAAETYLRKALDADPQLAQAAYNLSVVLSRDRMDEALTWCKKAVDLRPDEPKYAFALAYYQDLKGEAEAATTTLETLLERFPTSVDAYLFLGALYEKQGKKAEARRTYERALENEVIPDSYKQRIAASLDILNRSRAGNDKDAEEQNEK